MKATEDQIIVGFIKGRPELAKELLVRSGVGFDKNVSDSQLLESVVSAYTYSPKFRKEFQQVFQGVVEETFENFAGGDFNRAYEIQSGSSGFNDMNWDLKNFSGEFSSDKGEFSDFAGDFFNFTFPTPSGEAITSGKPLVLTSKGEKFSDQVGNISGERFARIGQFFKNTFTNKEGKFDTDKANSILNTGFGVLNSIRGKKGDLTSNYSSENKSEETTPEGWWSNLQTWQKVAIIGVPVIIVGLVAYKFSKAKK